MLTLGGAPFRFAGANLYWLGLDENVGGIAYPTDFRIGDGLATALEMGARVVRSHTLGISVGGPLSFEPSLGSFDDAALSAADDAIAYAGSRGIRLIIPLSDNYQYYMGGKYVFTRWRGIPDCQVDEFFTNGTVIGDFESYIQHLLTHVNHVTGVAYKDDPTVLAWETGNELDTVSPPGNYAILTPWTQTIAGYIKSIDASHLVSDGYAGRYHDPAALALADVDLYTSHFYGTYATTSYLDSASAPVLAAGKAFFVGELDWTAPMDLASYLASIQSTGTAGDLYWSLFPHGDDYGYVQHSDGYTLHYPGDSPTMQARAQELRTHAYAMAGLALPAPMLPPPPLVTSAMAVTGGDSIAWRGAVGAGVYTVEAASTVSGPWTLLCDRCVTDNGTPWVETTFTSSPSYFRVTPYNIDGMAGATSPVAAGP